jgi:hypothetical protein
MLKFYSQNKELIDNLWAFLGILAGVMALWWKISLSFTKTYLEFHRLQLHTKQMEAVLNQMTRALITHTEQLDARERDLRKLEGAIEVQRRDLVGIIASLQQSTGSLDAMWRTLQNLFPERVPRRASDKAG